MIIELEYLRDLSVEYRTKKEKLEVLLKAKIEENKDLSL